MLYVTGIFFTVSQFYDNFIKILLQFDSLKTHFMKIQLSFIILRKISEKTVHFSQF